MTPVEMRPFSIFRNREEQQEYELQRKNRKKETRQQRRKRLQNEREKRMEAAKEKQAANNIDNPGEDSKDDSERRYDTLITY